MNRKQAIGMAGSFVALIALLAWFAVSRKVLAGIAPPLDEPGARLAYMARWLVAPGLTLLVGVWVAARRGFLGEAIDGTRTPTNAALEINLRYNQNTVEQVVLAAIAWAGLSLTLPIGEMYLIPAMACTFLVGRASFWIGYLIYPVGRAFGMVVTILPTVCAYAWLIWRAFAR